MKNPNYGQQQKMKKLGPVELAEYCQKNDFAMPQTSVPVSGLVAQPVAPMPETTVVLTPVSDHEVEQPQTEQAPSVVTTVTTSPAACESADDSEEKESEGILELASRQFFALKNRLEQNAAHSVLNWDEMADLEATLFPFYSEKTVEVVPPKVAELPPGQRWAMVIGEPMNRTQKFIRFIEDANDAPHKMLYVNHHSARMMGRKLRVKPNPNENQGGYIVA